MTTSATLRLGDLEVKRIGLGTNRLRNTPTDRAFLEEVVAAGLAHIDTAHTYTDGESEEAIGEAGLASASRCVIATKGGWSSGQPDVLRAEIEASLGRLRAPSIPLYYLHRPDSQIRIEDSLAVIKEYHDAGKIRHVGISHVGLDEIERARAVVPIAAVQNHYNLSERRHEDVVDYCAEEGIVFVPYFPLQDREDERVAEVARARSATPAQIVLAWLLRRSPAMLPIPGTLSLDHARENLASIDIELSDAEYDALS